MYLQYHGIESTRTFRRFFDRYKFLELTHKVVDDKRLSLNLIVLIWSEIVYPDTKQSRQLSQILLCHYHLTVFHKYIGSICRKRVDIFELCQSYLVSFISQHFRCRKQVPVCASKADNEQFRIIGITFNLQFRNFYIGNLLVS